MPITPQLLSIGVCLILPMNMFYDKPVRVNVHVVVLYRCVFTPS